MRLSKQPQERVRCRIRIRNKEFDREEVLKIFEIIKEAQI